MRRLAWVASAVIVCSSSIAYADEQMQMLAVSGAWIATAHSPSLVAAADVCLALNPTTGVAFRYSEDGAEIRVSDKQWSLPTGITGSVSVSVGGFSKRFDIDGNTADGISAPIAANDLTLLFSAMNNAATMLVTPGKAKPLNVSLTGSTKATNAFLTCAGVRNGASSSGSNPFQ